MCGPIAGMRSSDSRYILGVDYAGHQVCGVSTATQRRYCKRAGPLKQMGPASLPTPLLPARGLPKKDLATGVSRPVSTGSEDPGIRWRRHRCSRRHPVPSGSGTNPKIAAFAFRFRDRSILGGQVFQMTALAEAPAIVSLPDRTDRPVLALRSRSYQWSSLLRAETLYEKSSWTAWTGATTPNWFEFSSDSKSLNYLSEKLSDLSDDLRLLPISESGKQVIHRKRNHRWTRVDKSTLRRRSLAVALGEQPQTQGVELYEALGVLLVVGSRIVLERDVPLRI